MRFGSLFSGIGGIDLGLQRAGMSCRWQVEINPFCSQVLATNWPKVKRHDNICDVEGRHLEPVDLVCGGFPCEDISLASATGVGIIGQRSRLWSQLARVLAEVRPRWALIENVPALRSRGLALVLQDLWALGFDAEWHCIPAGAFGAPHRRDRLFVVAYRRGAFRQAIIPQDAVANPHGEPLVRTAIPWKKRHAWTAEPRMVRMAHGVPHRVDRAGALGRAVVPQVAEWIGQKIKMNDFRE
jgi:DNA (cytosine-5)-methyltransferase 1